MINAIDATGAEAFLLRCRANTSQRVPLTGHANAGSLLLRNSFRNLEQVFVCSL